VPAHLGHRCGGCIKIGADKLAPFFSVELFGDAGRPDQIAEHEAAFAGGFDPGGDQCRRSRRRDRRWYGGLRRCTAQFRDGFQQLLAMAKRGNADVLEIVVRQPAQQLTVDVVGAEQLGILGETDPAEPTVDVQV
jgi:hypothetical protein